MAEAGRSMSTYKPRIVLDFDGVLHSYASGWVDAETIPDDPTEGAQDFVGRLFADGWDVVIQSTRAATVQGANAIAEWLLAHGFPIPDGDPTSDPRGRYTITAEKPPALIYLDDRALRFEGPPWPTPEQLTAASRPWNKAIT